MHDGSFCEGAMFSILIVTIVTLFLIWSTSHGQFEQPNFNATHNLTNLTQIFSQ